MVADIKNPRGVPVGISSPSVVVVESDVDSVGSGALVLDVIEVKGKGENIDLTFSQRGRVPKHAVF